MTVTNNNNNDDDNTDISGGLELVVFDFDETIVDCNSDTYINELAPDGVIPSDIISRYWDHNNWTDYMRHVFAYLNKCGVSEAEMRQCLERMPFVAGVRELITHLKNCGPNQFELIILSDANSVFIAHTLAYHHLDKAFRKVFTNPAKFDARGCLQIEEYHQQNWCDISAKNLCKGHVLREYVRKRAEDDGVTYARINYIGDGQNDTCPSLLALGVSDRVFARSGYPLHTRLAVNSELKAQLNPFASGLEIWSVLSSAKHSNIAMNNLSSDEESSSISDLSSIGSDAEK